MFRPGTIRVYSLKHLFVRATESAVNRNSWPSSRVFCKKLGDMAGEPVVHEAARPLTWLLGQWESIEAVVEFPTMKTITYKENATFTQLGQPLLNFFTEAFETESNAPLHRESGFIRIQPGTNNIAFICAQNIGLVDLEEGEVNGTSLTVETKVIGRMSFSSLTETTRIKRTFQLKDDNHLEQIVFMATNKTPALTKHLHVLYKKK